MVPLTKGGDDPGPDAPKEVTMFAKALIAALVLAGVSLNFVTDAAAVPTKHSTGYSHINSGYGPPSNWDEIEHSVGSGN
jgi:hypothetical protein